MDEGFQTVTALDGHEDDQVTGPFERTRCWRWGLERTGRCCGRPCRGLWSPLATGISALILWFVVFMQSSPNVTLRAKRTGCSA